MIAASVNYNFSLVEVVGDLIRTTSTTFRLWKIEAACLFSEKYAVSGNTNQGVLSFQS